MSFLPDIKWHTESLGAKAKGKPNALNKMQSRNGTKGNKRHLFNLHLYPKSKAFRIQPCFL